MKQNESEWIVYHDVITDVIKESGLNENIFYDLRGNHDNFAVPINGGSYDFYEKYSVNAMLGRKENVQSVTLEELNTGRKIGRLEFFKATHTKKDGSHVNVETQSIMEKANEKLAEYQAMDGDGDADMIETQILTQVIGQERHGRVRGLGLGPTPTSYYGNSSGPNSTSSIGHAECINRYNHIEEKFMKMEQERDQERGYYKTLLTFLQNQFPGVNFPLPNIGASTSQSQNQTTDPEIPEANIAGSS